MAELQLIVVDASIDNRAATELKRRGRDAVALSALGLRHENDEDLLPKLTDLYASEGRAWMLVTGDDAMPREHGGTLSRLGVTLATIDPRRPDDVLQDAWQRDVVHRWAHAMQVQAPGTIRRYSPHRNATWKAPRR